MINLLPFGIILGALYFFLAKKSITSAFYFLLPLIPLDNRLYFAFGFERATPARWAILGISLWFVFSFLKNTLKNKTNIISKIKLEILEDKILGLFILTALIRIASLIWVPDFIGSLSLNAFFLEIFLLFLIARSVFKKEGLNFIYKSLIIYAFSGFILSLWSPVQYYFYKVHDRILPGVWPLINTPVRIGSLFWDINHFGAFSATCLFILISSLFVFKGKKKLIVIFPLIVTGIAFFMTVSRSAFIGFFGGIVVFLLGLLFSKKYKIILGLVFSLVLLIGSFLFLEQKGVIKVPQKLYERFFSLNFSYRVWDDSINAHSALILGSWQILEDSPIIGSGYGSFDTSFRKTPVAKEYFEFDPVKDAKIPAHSVIFEPLSATGFLGGSVFYILIFLIIFYLAKSAVFLLLQNNKNSFLYLGVLSGVVSILVSGIFYSYNLEFFYVFIFMGIFMGYQYHNKYKVSYKTIFALIFLITLAGSFIFYKLGRATLADWDESIYAQISHNILHIKGDPFAFVWREDYLRDGKGFWFEKPPLFIWLTSLTYFTFGVNEFSARFVSAISGVFGVIFLYFFGKNLFGRKAGILAGIILATTTHWIFQSRNGTMDIMASLFILFSLYSFWNAYKGLWKFRYTGIFLGLTILTKGPVVIIPALTILLFVIYDFFQSRKFPISAKNIFVTLFWILLISLPWHLVEIYRFGQEFIDTYFWYHILERSKGIEGHQNDLWWYLVVIKVWFRQWFVVLIPSVIWALKAVFLEKNQATKQPLILVTIWATVTLATLSLSSSKIQWYIVPIYPALALIVAWFLQEVLKIVEVKIKSSAFFVSLILATGASIYLLISWKSMWIAEDASRDIAILGSQVSELKDADHFLPRKAPIYFYNMAPGPSYFYIQRYSRPVSQNQIEDMVKSSLGKAFMAIGKESSFNKLKNKYQQSRIAIYKKEGDYVLFGKDWLSVPTQFNLQNYQVPVSVYDPFYFEKELFGSKWINEESHD